MGKKLKHIFIVEASDYCKCNIDDLNAKMVLDNLKELQRKGHTILLASHDSRVLEYADAVIKMTDGKVICD